MNSNDLIDLENDRTVCFVFERARAPRHVLLGKGQPISGNCKFLPEHFKGTKAMARGHEGNLLRYLCEKSGVK